MVQKFANLVDLVKSFQTSIYYLLAKFGFDTAENEPLKFAKNEPKVRTQARINTGSLASTYSAAAQHSPAEQAFRAARWYR